MGTGKKQYEISTNQVHRSKQEEEEENAVYLPVEEVITEQDNAPLEEQAQLPLKNTQFQTAYFKLIFEGQKRLRGAVSGKPVSVVQLALNDLEGITPVAVTGMYDVATMQAVSQLQEAAGFSGEEINGIFDGATLAALDEKLAVSQQTTEEVPFLASYKDLQIPRGSTLYVKIIHNWGGVFHFIKTGTTSIPIPGERFKTGSNKPKAVTFYAEGRNKKFYIAVVPGEGSEYVPKWSDISPDPAQEAQAAAEESGQAPGGGTTAAAPQAAQTSDSGSSGSTESMDKYFTHTWQVDQFGQESLFVWEVGQDKKYNSFSAANNYIMEQLKKPDHDPRFDQFKKRPTYSDMSKYPKWGAPTYWFKKTVGWDNKDTDDVAGDTSDLAEFRTAKGQKDGTGFFLSMWLFDPNYGKKEPEPAPKKADNFADFAGLERNDRGKITGHPGVKLHSKPGHSFKTGIVISHGSTVTVVAESDPSSPGFVYVITADGKKGWIPERYISKQPGDPRAKMHRILKDETLQGLMEEYYKDYEISTGNDYRIIAMAVYLYNKGRKPSPYLMDEPDRDFWDETRDFVDGDMAENRRIYQSIKLKEGHHIWLPSKEMIDQMKSLGQIETRPEWMNNAIGFTKGVAGFVVGVVEGFLLGLWEMIEGLYDMGVMIGETIKKLLTGELFDQISEMWEAFKQIDEAKLKEMIDGIGDMIGEAANGFMKKWNHGSPYERWRFRGDIVGRIVLEVLLAIFTGGAGNVAKIMGYIGKVAPKLFKVLSKILKTVEKVNPGNLLKKRRGIDLDKKPDIDPKYKQIQGSDVDAHYLKNKKRLDKEAYDDADPSFRDKKDQHSLDKLQALGMAKAIEEMYDAMDPGLPIGAVIKILDAAITVQGVHFKYRKLGPGHYMIRMIGSDSEVDDHTTSTEESSDGSPRGNASLLDDSGRFVDEATENNYQNYIARKNREGKPARDRLEWKEERDYWLNDSPMARGNNFNKKASREKWYDADELHLENGKRLDSYNLDPPEIISRKATNLDQIELETFESYLKELKKKYAPGTEIRSNKYPRLDGKKLEGKLILEIPDSNAGLSNISDFQDIAKRYDIELRFSPE